MEAKYDKIGVGYNTTRKADSYLSERLLKNLNPTIGGVYLDIGCGTGNYTDILQKLGYNFIGIDPSTQMLDEAKLKNYNIDWRIGNAENTGLKTNSVDGIIASLTIHHWADIEQGFTELARVLKPNGNIVIFTSTPEQMNGYWLNHYFPRMLEDSAKQMPTLDTVEKAMKVAGLEITNTEPYYIKPDLEDLFLYSGKHKPELYFQPEIRKGISSFAALANAEEVEKGLTELKKDIDSGQIDDVTKLYENDLGDYLYIVAENKTSNI